MSINAKETYSKFIKSEAKRLGFLSCGISKAGFLEEEAPRLEKWLNNNHHGQMAYMENYFDKRLDIPQERKPSRFASDFINFEYVTFALILIFLKMKPLHQQVLK